MRSMGRLLRILIVLTLLVSLCSLAACQGGGDQAAYEKVIEAVRAEVWKGIAAGKTSSASVAMMDDGNIVYLESFGMADREKSVPVKASTLFNVGSVSKTFCTTAVMLLVDDGKVKLDDPVVKYLPEFKMADPRYKDITVRMLLNHSSGLPGSSFANDFGYVYNKTVYGDLLACLARSHLKAAPGETAPYCNDGFTLAEMLVAKVSGQKFVDFLDERIFAPLSLTRTGACVGMRDDDDIAACYQADTGQKFPPEVLSVLGAGGLSSTAEEVLMFADSFSKGGNRILSDESIAEMTKAQPSRLAQQALMEAGKNPEASWGLGLDIVDAPYYRDKGIKVIGKGGSATDFHAMMLSATEKRVSVAVVQAGNGNDTSEVGLMMLDGMLQAKGLLKEEKTAVGPPPAPQPLPAGYEAFAGMYAEAGDLYRISVDRETNTVTKQTMYGDEVADEDTMTYRDGMLTGTDGASHALIAVGGRRYFLNTVFEDRLFMTKAEKIEAVAEAVALKEDINGAQWLRRNAKPFEEVVMMYAHILTSMTPDALPGYVDLLGLKRIESPEFAGMVSTDTRDQRELTLIEKDGQTWLWLSDLLFSPADGAAALGAGEKSMTIGKDGYSEWFKTGEGLVVGFSKPDGARAVVFSADGEPTYDSILDEGKVYVPAGSFIELTGMPGDVLKVNARAAGQ
jgi:CubicO group peptidase (beta-lactamase class C family)